MHRASFLLLTAFMGTAPAMGQQSPLRLFQNDFSYVGAFRVENVISADPRCGGGGTGGVGSKYGAFYKDPSTSKKTFYVQHGTTNIGRACIGQFEIPVDLGSNADFRQLPMARNLQNFADISRGSITNENVLNPGETNCSSEGCSLRGVLPYGGRLVYSVGIIYSTSAMRNSLGVAPGTSVATVGAAQYGRLASPRNARQGSGPMSLVPSEWQDALGGKAILMHCCNSIISNSSLGPAIHAFDPDDVGVKNPVPSAKLLDYPLSSPLCGFYGCEVTQNGLFNLATDMLAAVIVPRTRSLLVVGRHGVGPYCYGDRVECGAPYEGKEPHAHPYILQVWAYDLQHLADVRRGTRRPEEVRPYATYELRGRPEGIVPWSTTSIFLDPEARRLYVMADLYLDGARVDVWQLSEGSAGPAQPNPPGAVGVR